MTRRRVRKHAIRLHGGVFIFRRPTDERVKVGSVIYESESEATVLLHELHDRPRIRRSYQRSWLNAFPQHVAAGYKTQSLFVGDKYAPAGHGPI